MPPAPVVVQPSSVRSQHYILRTHHYRDSLTRLNFLLGVCGPHLEAFHYREILVASHSQLPAELNQLGMHVSSLILQLHVISPHRGTQ